jgi:DNA primase
VCSAAVATKLNPARSYDAIAGWIVPDLMDRPLTLVHCPHPALDDL